MCEVALRSTSHELQCTLIIEGAQQFRVAFLRKCSLLQIYHVSDSVASLFSCWRLFHRLNLFQRSVALKYNKGIDLTDGNFIKHLEEHSRQWWKWNTRQLINFYNSQCTMKKRSLKRCRNPKVKSINLQTFHFQRKRRFKKLRILSVFEIQTTNFKSKRAFSKNPEFRKQLGKSIAYHAVIDEKSCQFRLHQLI